MKLTKKEMILVLIAACLVLLLVLVPAFAAGNGKGRGPGRGKVDGIWCYTPNPEMETWMPIEYYESAQDIIDGNPVENYGAPGTGLLRVPYTATWTGTISGESREYGVVVMHQVAPEEIAPRVFLDALVIDEAKVRGKKGSLYMDAYGERLADGTWEGNWVITGGTGKLANLQGHGSFWGPGWQGDFEECGVIYYKVEELEFER